MRARHQSQSEVVQTTIFINDLIDINNYLVGWEGADGFINSPYPQDSPLCEKSGPTAGTSTNHYYLALVLEMEEINKISCIQRFFFSEFILFSQ